MTGRPETPRAAGDPGRGLLWIVLGMLGATALGLVAVAVGAVIARNDEAARRALDYETFLASVDELLERVGDERLVRFERLQSRIAGGRTVAWDTLVVVASPDAVPSLAPAGFLHDQVQAYNRFQRERIALARERGEWFDRLAPYNPSVFRGVRDGEGTRRLARAPAAWSLRVPSPFEGAWRGEIRARDVRRGAGLLGIDASVSLRHPTRLFRTVDGRRQRCEFEPRATEVRAFCLSEQRTPQAIFRLAEDDPTPRTAVAGWTELWVDGARIAPGDSVAVREGSILQLDPLAPMLLAEFWEGVLSREQWVNGRMRRTGDLPPPLDLFAPLDDPRAGDAAASDAALNVSVDAGASMELTAALEAFLRNEVDLPIDAAQVVLARVPDGEIVAVAEVGRRVAPGRSVLFEPVAPGSAVKPILAAAILSQRPELAGLSIPARTADVRSVLGLAPVPARLAFASVLYCAPRSGSRVDLREFLRCSNNEYAATLVAAGSLPDDLVGRALEGRVLGAVRFDRSTLLTSPLADGLTGLFDVSPDPVVTGRLRRTDAVWAGLRLADGTPVSAPWEARPSVSRPLLLASTAAEETEPGLLYRYALGAWENRWTLLDLTQAFARVATDRRVALRFSRADDAVPPDGLGLEAQRWYPDLMAGLRDVAADGTGAGLARDWAADGLPGSVLAKTGTLSEPGDAGRDDDLFVKSLLFAVGEEGPGAGRPLRCGVVGGIHLRFAEGPLSGSLPSWQLDFARERLGAFLARYWDGLGICPDPGSS